jgi:hypothetical protein
MSSLSLNAALRVCKVDTAYADKINSDRFLNPNNMLCPLWNGMDSAGRPVAPDSFMTKTAGCNSALDRVMVENDVFRPRYTEYITLNASGINQGNNLDIHYNDSVNRTNELRNIQENNPHFGNQYAAQVYPRCKMMNQQNNSSIENYESTFESENTRFLNESINAGKAYDRRICSGF